MVQCEGWVLCTEGACEASSIALRTDRRSILSMIILSPVVDPQVLRWLLLEANGPSDHDRLHSGPPRLQRLVTVGPAR